MMIVSGDANTVTGSYERKDLRIPKLRVSGLGDG